MDYKKLNKDSSNLSTTVIDIFHPINEFEKLHNSQDEAAVYLVDDQLQEAERDTCGIFQLYFYENLFQLLPYGKTISDKNLAKNTISKLLNEIFTLYKTSNEHKIETFAEVNNIKFS